MDKHNQSQSHRYQLSAAANYSFDRIVLQYGCDLKTENGYFEDQRLLVRYLTVF